VRWPTTWSQDARTSLAPAVGLDDFFAYDMFDSEDWWKAQVVSKSIVEEGRPIIWTDDDIPPADIDYFRGEVHEVSSLIAVPPAEQGLASADLLQIHDFIVDGSSLESLHA